MKPYQILLHSLIFIVKKGKKEDKGVDLNGSGEFQRTPRQVSRQVAGDADPGVISEDEDEFTVSASSNVFLANGLTYNSHTGQLVFLQCLSLLNKFDKRKT